MSLVRYRGGVFFEDCYGMADLDAAWSGPPDQFRLASVTKQLTATAVIQLAKREAGLRDNLTQIFPGFPDYGERSPSDTC